MLKALPLFIFVYICVNICVYWEPYSFRLPSDFQSYKDKGNIETYWL